MSVSDDPDASFDPRRLPLQFQHEAPVAQLQARWDTLTKRGKAVGRLTRIVLGLTLLAGALGVVANYAFALSMFHDGQLWQRPEWLLPVASTLFFIGAVGPWAIQRFTPPPQLDSRKRELVDALLVFLAREVAPEASVSLHVDLRSARLHGLIPSSDPSFDWSGLAVPDAEPKAHDWLCVRAPLAKLALAMRARTLLGTSGDELRVRDEVGIELRGQGLATELRAKSPAKLTTTLLAHDLEPERARLQFRGGCAARRVPFVEQGGRRNVPLLPEPPSYEFLDMEWLLAGDALVEHIEAARALVRPRGA